MKHLKRFNENKENFKEDLQEFCEKNLAYLLDDAVLSIVERPGGYEELLLLRIKLNEPKTWLEIKDDIIPFLTLLNEKYEITSKVFGKGGNIRFYIGLNTDELWLNQSYVEDSVENLINDLPNSVTATKLYRYSLDDIRIYIKREHPKKGIINKLKLFFNK